MHYIHKKILYSQNIIDIKYNYNLQILKKSLT
jgi:hypothetical protein